MCDVDIVHWKVDIHLTDMNLRLNLKYKHMEHKWASIWKEDRYNIWHLDIVIVVVVVVVDVVEVVEVCRSWVCGCSCVVVVVDVVVFEDPWLRVEFV